MGTLSNFKWTAPIMGTVDPKTPLRIPQYGHRNGEMEHPTVQGWYWFKGRMDDRNEAGLVKVNMPDSSFPNLTVSPQWIQGWMEAELFDGQWWGPIVPPWSDNGAE